MNATETTTQPATLASACEAAGLSLQCSPPRPGVDSEHSGAAWPHIAYTVTILRNGREVWSGPYKLGVGHVKPGKPRVTMYGPTPFTVEEESLLTTWQYKPHAQFLSKELWSSVAAKLAVAQKVAPKLADVVHSLISDGSAYFDGQSFEEWAGDLGYDSDSRKAEETFRTCDAIGRKLQCALGRELVEKLREAAHDY